MERQNNLETTSEARARVPLALDRTGWRVRPLLVAVYAGRVVALRRVMRRMSGGLQDGLLVVAALTALLGVSLGMSALVRWLLDSLLALVVLAVPLGAPFCCGGG